MFLNMIQQNLLFDFHLNICFLPFFINIKLSTANLFLKKFHTDFYFSLINFKSIFKIMTFFNKLISSIKQLTKQLQQAQIAVINNQITINDKYFLLQELNLHLSKMNVKS